MEPGSDQQTITVNGQQGGQQHVLTTNSDGSLSISGLQGHIIGSLGNVQGNRKTENFRKLKLENKVEFCEKNGFCLSYISFIFKTVVLKNWLQDLY